MGVINVTPDSFSDGGIFLNKDNAINHAVQLMDEGAHILDIGGESSRPGADTVGVEEECARVVPVIEGLAEEAAERGVVISIDTRNPATMREAVNAGAGMINDVTALREDEGSLETIAQLGVPVCLMHMQGSPQNMQEKPQYFNVVEEVVDFLSERIKACTAAGFDADHLIVDPGIGFGKTLEHNLQLLKNLSRFNDLGVPVLLGASRKSFIEKICGSLPADQRLPGSLAAALYGLKAGCSIFRVHDVAATKQAFDVFNAIDQC